MIPSFTLTRSAECRSWSFIGTVATSQKRQWEIAVLRLGMEQGGRVSVDEIDRLLLMGGRRAVAERLHEVLSKLRLIREDGWLTDEGRRAAETGEVLVPQRGGWRITLSDDPLLPSSIVALDQSEPPSAHEQVRGKHKDKPRDKGQAIPSELLRLLGKPHTESIGTRREVRIDEIEGSMGIRSPAC